MKNHLALLCFFVLPFSLIAGENPFYLKGGEKILFLGDSNTFAGTFISYLETYLITRFPEKKFELINLGLPSETVTGLSEPDHPFPRPNVHDRIDKALAKIKPDVVVVCYGMNDGIYHPFDKDRFKQYQEGIRKVLKKAMEAGARTTLLSPSPFDPVPIRKRLLPLDTAEKFSYMKPFEGYDKALAKYSEWIMTLKEENLIVADPHSAVHQFLAAVRKTMPAYFLSGDGIHPNPTGHALVAGTVLRAWNAPGLEILEMKSAGDSGELKTNHRLPMPYDSRWDSKNFTPDHFGPWNRLVLKAPGWKQAEGDLFEGSKKLGRFSKAELAQGIDLGKLNAFSLGAKSQKLAKLVDDRQKLLGLAWLSDVGHTRPQTPKGLPLGEAKTKAESWNQQIQDLAQPQEIHLTLKRPQ